MAIPRGCVEKLSTYCAATAPEEVPAELRMLDFLHGEDRVCHFVDWVRATQSRETLATAALADDGRGKCLT